MKTRFFLLAIIYVLTSCDPYGEYQYYIKNNSDSTAFLEYKKLYNDTIFTKQIEPKNIILVEEYSSINGIYDYGNDFLNRYFETFKIFTDSINGSPLQKDITKRNNWHYEIKPTGCMGRCGENIYTFKINNSDL